MRHNRQPNAWKTETLQNQHRRNNQQNPIKLQSKKLLQTEKLSKLNFKNITKQTIKFSKKVISNLTENEIKVINQFFEHKIFQPNLIDEKGIFHEKIREHPAIKWALTKSLTKT